MSDMKTRMIESYERGECSYEGSYDYVRESMAHAADRARDREKEDWVDQVNAAMPPYKRRRPRDAEEAALLRERGTSEELIGPENAADSVTQNFGLPEKDES